MDDDRNDSGIKFEIDPAWYRQVDGRGGKKPKVPAPHTAASAKVLNKSRDAAQADAPRPIHNVAMRPKAFVQQPAKTREELVHIGLRIPVSMLVELDALGGSLSENIREFIQQGLAATRRR